MCDVGKASPTWFSFKNLTEMARKMVVVDPNILIGALVILSVLAYIFILRKIKIKQPTPADVASAPTAMPKNAMEEAATDRCEASEATPEVQQSEKPTENKARTECPRHFGYLHNRRKKDIIPSECLECNKMAECMAKKTPKKTRSKRKVALLAAVDEETQVQREP